MRSRKSNKLSGNKPKKLYKMAKSNLTSKKTKQTKNLNKLSRNKSKISKKRTKKNIKKNHKNIMKGGNLSAQDIKNNYYLCTRSRYDKAIVDMLRPFGSLDEVSEIYSDKKEELEKIKAYKIESDKISDLKVDEKTSQFGLYFRFVEKKLIDEIYTNYQQNSDEFKKIRSFVFDIDKLLQYINIEQNTIPLCWFSVFNAFGYQNSRYTVLFNKDIDLFLNGVGNLLLENEYIDTHEFVCRIPIPLTEDSGFKGKINSNILDGTKKYKEIYDKFVLSSSFLDKLVKKKNPLESNKHIKWKCSKIHSISHNLLCHLYTNDKGEELTINMDSEPKIILEPGDLELA